MRKNKPNVNYEVIIQPNQSWFYIDWKGLLQYRDLLFFLIRRDFVSRYQQTILGPIWYIIQPLLTTLVFTVIFGNIAKIPTDGLPPSIFYLSSLMIWNYFAGSFNAVSNTFVSNAGIFGKVYFPRLIVPLSIIASNVFAFLIQLFTFLPIYLYFKFFTASGVLIQPNLSLLLLPLVFFQVAVFSLGIGLWITALSAKYRDILFLLSFLTQLWMYATPVIYPMSLVPQAWRWVMILNPMSSVVETFKYAFFGTGIFNIKYTLISLAIVFSIFVSGLLVFNRAERTFIDTI